LTLDPQSLGAWIAVYAAVVSTGALFLEIRRWFESGARLNLTYMLDAITFPRGHEDNMYIVVTVSNRGDTATTITNLGFQAYASRWTRFRGKASQSMLANNPSQAQPIPHVIEPGTRWMGMCIQNEEINQLLDTGLLWAEVYATHRDKPTSVRLKRRPKPKGKKIKGSDG
jgi:hypothetical protein